MRNDTTLAPREQTLDLNGHPFRFRVAGRGPALMVQAPGWGIGAGLYERTLAPLERQFTVIYHDPRGSGGSEPVATESVHVGSFVSDLDQLREHLGIDSFALLGHSHGGFIAMNYALEHPGRVSRLVLVDAQLGVDEPREDVQRTLPLLAKDPRFAEAVSLFASPWKLDSDDDLKALVVGVWPLYFANPAAPAAVAALETLHAGVFRVEAMKASAATNAQFLVRPRLGAIRARTLVLVGRHDFICSPVQAQIIHEGVRRSRLEIFERSGHFPWLEEPESFFPVVARFLDAAD